MFTNVHEIKLISTEFPNSDKAIKDTPPELANNTFYWINEDEADLGYPVYKYSIPPGNYDTYTLQIALSSNMNRVRRRKGAGQFHYFDVSVSILTDVVTFKSLLITNLEANPYLVTKDSNILTVTQNNHNFKMGDSVALFSSQSTGGIDSARLDGYYTIHDVPSINTFQVLLNTVAVQNIQGGGTLVKSGRRAPFKMLVGSQTDNIGNPLGFSLEDSAIPIGQIMKTDDADITTVSGITPAQTSLTRFILPETLKRSFDIYQQCTLTVSGQERLIVSYDPSNNTATVSPGFTSLASTGETVFIDKGYRQVPVTNPIQTMVYEIQDVAILQNTQKIRLVYQTENDQGSGSVVQYFPTFTGTCPLQSQPGQFQMPETLARNNNVYQNCWIKIGQQVRLITQYNPVTNIATLQSPWTTLPTTGAQVSLYRPLFTSATIFDIVQMTPSINNTVVLETASPHGLSNQQLVTFARSRGTPNLDGGRLVSQVLSPTTFRVEFPMQTVEPVAFATTVNKRLPVTKLISGVSTSTLTIREHGFLTNQQIRIVSSQTTPSLDGVYTVTVLDADTITLPATVTSIMPRALLKVSGDFVRILNLETIPRITIKNDVFIVEDGTPGSFNIDFPATSIESMQNAKIGTNILEITHPEHGFNTVTFIDKIKSIYELQSTPVFTANDNIASIIANTTITLGNAKTFGSVSWFTPAAGTSYRVSLTVQGNPGTLTIRHNDLLNPILFTLAVTGTPTSHVVTISSNLQIYCQYDAVEGATVIINHVSLEKIVAGTMGVTTQFPHNLNGYEFTNVAIEEDLGDNSLANLTIPDHPFSYNDRIKLSDFQSSPSYDLPLDEFYQVARVVNNDVFTVKLPDLRTNIPATITVRTSGTDHEIVLSKTTSVPSIDGRYEVITQTDDLADFFPASATALNAFKISTRGNLTTGTPLDDIETPGYSGTVGFKNNVALYRARGATSTSLDIAGIPLYRLNGTYYDIDTLLDQDHYLIRIPDAYAVEKVQGGGNDVYVSSEKHGFNFLQDNTSDGVTLNRNIQLEGENYVFLVSPGLGTVLNSAGIDDVFAKLLLTEPPGLMIFNSFITNSKTFDEAPLPHLSEMEFKVLTGTGFLYDFNDVDFSFSLEIREYADTIAEAQVSSRRGAPETTNVLSSAARPMPAVKSRQSAPNNFERYGQLY